MDFDPPHVSHINKTFDLFSPRLGVTYRLNELLNIYGLVAQSQQVPSEGRDHGRTLTWMLQPHATTRSASRDARWNGHLMQTSITPP